MARRRRSRITAQFCAFRTVRIPIRTPAVAAADTGRMAAESAFIGNRLRLDSVLRAAEVEEQLRGKRFVVAYPCGDPQASRGNTGQRGERWLCNGAAIVCGQEKSRAGFSLDRTLLVSAGPFGSSDESRFHRYARIQPEQTRSGLPGRCPGSAIIGDGPEALSVYRAYRSARACFLRLSLSAGVKGLQRRAARRQGNRKG